MKMRIIIWLASLVLFNFIACTDKNQPSNPAVEFKCNNIACNIEKLDTLEVEALNSIADDVAQCKNAKLKALFFRRGAYQIAVLRNSSLPNCLKGGDADELTNSLTKILNSDVTGIVTAFESLRVGDYTQYGRCMAIYMVAMMRRQEFNQIFDIIQKLKSGNGPKENASKFLTEYILYGGGPRYQNLHNLGYVVGIVKDSADDLKIKINADVLKNRIGDGNNHLLTSKINFGDAILDFAYPDDMNGSYWETFFYISMSRAKKKN